MSDLGTWPSLKKEITEFLEEMTDYQREQFDSWCRDNLSDIEQGDLSLKTDAQVVYFEAGKDMKVRESNQHNAFIRRSRIVLPYSGIPFRGAQ